MPAVSCYAFCRRASTTGADAQHMNLSDMTCCIQDAHARMDKLPLSAVVMIYIASRPWMHAMTVVCMVPDISHTKSHKTKSMALIATLAGIAAVVVVVVAAAEAAGVGLAHPTPTTVDT